MVPVIIYAVRFQGSNIKIVWINNVTTQKTRILTLLHHFKTDNNVPVKLYIYGKKYKDWNVFLPLRERRRSRQVLSPVLMFSTWQAYRPSSRRDALGSGSSRVMLVPCWLDSTACVRGLGCSVRERQGCTEDTCSDWEMLVTRYQASLL